jgi:hypothetical protein
MPSGSHVSRSSALGAATPTRRSSQPSDASREESSWKGCSCNRLGARLPSQLEDEVIFHLDALIAVYGSKRVRDLLGSWSETCRSFYEGAQEAKRAPGRVPYPTQAMRDSRAAAIASEDALQAAAREDLEQANDPEKK